MKTFNDITGLQDPSCGYKFGWSTIKLWTNQTASCHRCFYEKIPDNFDDFHNTPGKLSDRLKMATGEWCGRGCEYCRDIEKVGGVSDRIDFNSQPLIENLVPNEIKSNYSLKTSPTIVEVYFNNKCNMKCVYCNSDFSSLWEKEDKKYGAFTKQEPGFTISTKTGFKEGYEERIEKWFDWLKREGHNLKEYNILGGEPFYQEEFQQNIDLFKELSFPELKLRIFSNFKVNENRFRKYLEDLQYLIDNNKLESVKIVASLECWDEQQEYIRTGLNLTQWENNMMTLLKEFPSIGVHIHGTLASLAIPTAHKLIRKVNEYKQIRYDLGVRKDMPPVFQTYNILVSPKFMAPSIFPTNYFDKQIEKMYNEFVLCKDHYRAKQILSYRDEFNSKPEDRKLIKSLINYLQKLDIRRNTNYLDKFPWLEEFND